VQSPNNQLPKTLSKSRWLTGWIVVALVGAATGLILLSFITSAGTPMPTPSANQSTNHDRPASPVEINPPQIDSSIDEIERELTNFETDFQSLLGE